MLWIDAVGGYLLCLADEIVIGQAVPGSTVDLALLADISRRHAKIIRDREGYVLEPLSGKVIIDGRLATGPVLLSDGQRFQLGDSVTIAFHRPHVLSSSARLEIVSGHRSVPSADGVILMSESCVLGPNSQNTILCRDWTSDVVLYRGADGLMCRALEAIEIDGRRHDGRGAVKAGQRVVGSDFSFALEAV
jgi:hypothetical protein